MTVTAHRPATTSIRVDSHTRDVFAAEAASVESTLSAYLAALADRLERERAYAELRAARLEERDDPAWQEEIGAWVDADLTEPSDV
ncbi:MAG: hypothetical protein LBM23_02210 [Propionibacteriaceae bacterium]|jgi:hypothetical protein|nr:hypothetical protein [Propionibacteriaceae bacterium]